MATTVEAVRKDFPVLERKVNGYPLCYMDSAASTLKPKQFVDAITEYYLMGASNVHRGVHQLSEQATQNYEAARQIVKDFINAGELAEVIFTSGTTDSINKVARGLSASYLQKGDEMAL